MKYSSKFSPVRPIFSINIPFLDNVEFINPTESKLLNIFIPIQKWRVHQNEQKNDYF